MMAKFSVVLIVAVIISGISAGFILDEAKIIKDKISHIGDGFFGGSKTTAESSAATKLSSSQQPTAQQPAQQQVVDSSKQPTVQHSPIESKHLQPATPEDSDIVVPAAGGAVVTQSPITSSTASREIINAPVRTCPDGQKMDPNRVCRDVFK